MDPDRCSTQEDTTLSELDDLEGLAPEQLRAAIAYSPDVLSPLTTQNAANSERKAWGSQWAIDLPPDELAWPDEMDKLPPLSLQRFKARGSNGTESTLELCSASPMTCSTSGWPVSYTHLTLPTKRIV